MKALREKVMVISADDSLQTEELTEVLKPNNS